MELSDYLEKKAAVTGKISELIWQYLIGYFEEYPNLYYFDTEDYQIVIYSKKEINYNKLIKIYGKVIIAEEKSKSPESQESYSEYHILVEDGKS